MKKKPAILFLLPVLLLLTGGGLKAGATDKATSALSGYTVRHHIRDHLGSVRAVTDATTGTVLETSDYLPFGTRWTMTGGTQDAASTLTDPSNRWRYSGKEEQQALSPDLSLLDYGARMYDPTLARWLTPDPLAEKQYQSGPYSFCYANPVIVIDKDGRYGETLWDVLNVVMDVKSLASNIKDGHVGSALVDAVGLVYDVAAVALPLVPAGAGTAIKALRKGDAVVDAAKFVHGNSKLSTKAQHAYDIINTKTGDIVKTGVSGGTIRNGKSVRAETQVRKWNREQGGTVFESVITKQIPEGEGARAKIYEYEKKRARELKKQEMLKDPYYHQRP